MATTTLTLRGSLLLFVMTAIDPSHGRNFQHHLARTISNPTDHNKTAWLQLTFGQGYFNLAKVAVYLDDQFLGEADPEEAVNAYLESRVPVTSPLTTPPREER